jgi:hypothetical protein
MGRHKTTICKSFAKMIYVYGDSFSCPPSHHYHHKEANQSWPKLVAKQLETKEINYGLGGSSFAHTFQEIKNSYNKWTADDIVIICQTSPRRKLFFKQLPHLSNLRNLINFHGFKFSEEQKDLLIKFCSDFFTNKEIAINEMTAYYALINMWLERKNTWCYVLRCFDFKDDVFEDFTRIRFSVGGDVNYISEYEYNPPEHVNDDRVGHLSLKNHYILANQVSKAIKEEKPINLKVKFEKGFLNQE